MAKLYRLIVAALLVGAALAAHAVTTVPKVTGYLWDSGGRPTDGLAYPSAAAACQRAQSTYPDRSVTSFVSWGSLGSSCIWRGLPDANGNETRMASHSAYPGTACPPDTKQNASGSCDVIDLPTQCEGGRERDASGQCVCKAGTSEPPGGIGACVAANDHAQQCFAFSGLETLSGGVLASDVALKGDVAHGANFCYPLADEPGKGCTVTFSRGSMATWSDGSKVSYGTYSMTPSSKTFGNNQPDYSCGSSAANTPTPNTTSTGEKCSGYLGTVNGVETCVPGTSGATGVDITGGTSTTTNSDGSGSTSSNSTTCNASSCTTTTITTTTNTSGSSSTSTSTTTQSRDDFCRGSGASTAACTGAAAGKAACEKNPMSAGCGGAPVGIQARDFYTPKGKTIGDSLNAAKDKLQASPIGGAMTGFFAVSGSGSCPVWTWVVPFFDKTVVVDAFCQAWVTQALSVMRIAVLLAASFIAFRIAVE